MGNESFMQQKYVFGIIGDYRLGYLQEKSARIKCRKTLTIAKCEYTLCKQRFIVN